MQKMPAPLHFMPPMECKEVDRIPEGDFWQYELKLNGYWTKDSAYPGQVM
jgi:ATP-dependent DNA ligase